MTSSLARRRWRGAAAGAVALAALGGCERGTGPDLRPPTGRIVFWDEAHGWPGDLPGREARPAGIFAVAADGSGLAVLRAEPAWDGDLARPPAWSGDAAFAPDGRRLAFAASADSGPPALWLMDADGSNQRPLGVAGRYPAWSPDSRHLAYAAEYTDASGLGRIGVWVVSADGSGARRVPMPDDARCVPAGGHCPSVTAVRWLPGGDRVAYSTWSMPPDRLTPGVHAAYTTRVSDGALAPLVVPGLSASALAGELPTWSADGRFVAGIDWGGSAAVIRVVTAAGAPAGTVRFQGAEQVYDPTLSPDGAWLAAGVQTLVEGRAVYELRVARRDGRGQRRIASDGYAPTWGAAPPAR